MKTFLIEKDICEKFGPIKVGYLQVDNITVTKTPPREKRIAREIEAIIRKRFDAKTLFEDDRIKEWMTFAGKMGLTEDDEMPANIDLLKRIISGKDIPKINCIVDAGNIISAKFRCPVGVFDAEKLGEKIILRVASVGEMYLPILEQTPIKVKEGEIVYTDSNGIFSRYSKDADRTKISESTTSLFCVVDGTKETPVEYVAEALTDLSNLLKDVCGDTIILTPNLAIANF